MLNLDTHVLLSALVGDVSQREKRLLRESRWGISAIVLWEIAKLRQLGRISMDLEASGIISSLSALHCWPIDLRVARQSCALDFRSDPADELIAATSVVHSAPLLTRDRVIRRSRMVPLA
jgi:PIN domain nuclease of toxin-antitoxin system